MSEEWRQLIDQHLEDRHGHADRFRCHVCGQPSQKLSVAKDAHGKLIWIDVRPLDRVRSAHCHQWTCHDDLHKGICRGCAEGLAAELAAERAERAEMQREADRFNQEYLARLEHHMDEAGVPHRPLTD